MVDPVRAGLCPHENSRRALPAATPLRARRGTPAVCRPRLAGRRCRVPPHSPSARRRRADPCNLGGRCGLLARSLHQRVRAVARRTRTRALDELPAGTHHARVDAAASRSATALGGGHQRLPHRRAGAGHVDAVRESPAPTLGPERHRGGAAVARTPGDRRERFTGHPRGCHEHGVHGRAGRVGHPAGDRLGARPARGALRRRVRHIARRLHGSHDCRPGRRSGRRHRRCPRERPGTRHPPTGRTAAAALLRAVGPVLGAVRADPLGGIAAVATLQGPP